MISRISHILISISLIMVFIGVSSTSAQTTIKVGRVYPGEIDMSGFTMKRSGTVRIYGKGAGHSDWEDNLQFYGWILNSKTRKVVWHLEDVDEADNDDGVFGFDIKVDLPKGDYEIYYAGSRSYYFKSYDLGDLIHQIFSGDHFDDFSKRRTKLYMVLQGAEDVVEQKDPIELADKSAEGAVVSIHRVGDYEEIEKRFTLEKETRFNLYTIGEGRAGEVFDFAWIYDVNKNERVWSFNSRYADHAGGGKKNLMFDKEITLPAGSYIVKYVTDDSHSYDEWNVKPPTDPQFWGITMKVVNPRDKKNVLPFSKDDVINPIVEITRVRDDQYYSQGFSLKKDMDVRVFCIGEGSRDMDDYGWISNADTREKVWEMRYRDTEHAGGAGKNRMVNEVIKLKKGNYIAYYMTDDSHSYRDWNSEAPYEKERWGITIWPTNKKDAKYTVKFDDDEYKSDNIVAEITRVRDSRKIRKNFSLREDTRVRIVAVGEGERRDMFDYGWIENENGRVVWEMTYRMTDHAGGARKNRLFNDVIILSKGNYKVFFVTDDSHSYKDWNDDPPTNQENYGITLFREK